MKLVDCYYCGSSNSTHYAEENGYNLVKCSQCGLLYVNPRPDDKEIESAHKVGLHKGAKTINVVGSFNRQKVRAYLLTFKELYGRNLEKVPVNWLDIGCGYGEFLMALKEVGPGIVTCGCEPNALKRQSASERKLNVSWFDLSSHAETYDAISLLNVFSHLPNPPQTLREWTRLLKPGGEIVIQTGDEAELNSGDQFRPFQLPDHLSFASQTIVTDILRQCGFEIIAVVKYRFPRLVSFSSFSLAKEVLKLAWPGKSSMVKYMLKVNPPRTDMYIRARLLR